MNPGQRVSFLIGQKTAYGNTVGTESAGGYLVAIDPQYLGASMGVLRIVAFFAAVSLTQVS